MTIFISHPITELSNEEINKIRSEAIKEIDNIIGEDNIYTIIDQRFLDNVPEDADYVWYLAEDLKILDKADAVYFAKGYKKSKGCLLEYSYCNIYGKKIINKY